MADTELRWTVVQRYEFIEWRAFWTGRVNRKDLEEQFQISTPQASIDLRDYQQLAPDNIVYDASEKTYVRTQTFRPKYMTLSPERFLLQLQAMESNAIRRSDTWFDTVPATDILPTVAQGPEAYILRPLVQAIEEGRAVSINYQSFNSEGLRKIRPHAFVNDGFRWHCRAYSFEHADFRDYVLGRILSPPGPFESCDVDSSCDVEWNTTINLKLKPHPKLKDGQRKAIEHEYRMGGGGLILPVRVATAYYFIRRHNLDLQDRIGDPTRVQLWLDNLFELDDAIASAREASQVLLKQRSLN